MPTPPAPETHARGSGPQHYRPAARVLHWLTVLLLMAQFPAGLYMVYRGPGQNVWDLTTNTLYAAHKLTGVVILTVVLLRLLYRFAIGPPPPEPTLTPWQKVISAMNHWSMYLLLVLVPSLGYLAICYFPALTIFGEFALPAVVAPDRAQYDRVIGWHAAGAGALAALVALHVAAALYHHIVRRDNVLARMLPSLRR